MRRKIKEMKKAVSILQALPKAVIRFRVAGTFTLATLFTALAGNHTAYAAGTKIGKSKLATGTQKLIADATTWLMVLAPVLAGLLIIYFCIRRSAADEMDQKKWNNRIVAAIVSCIGAVIGSATLGVIVGYYQ